MSSFKDIGVEKIGHVGLIEVVGNIRQVRHSEVRLPPR